MASSASSIAHAQIEFLEDTLRQMDQRHAIMYQALSDAEAVLEHAKHEVDMLRLQYETMRASRAALRADIEARRAASEREKCDLAALRARKILATVPVELLRTIFIEATNSENEVWSPDAHDWGVREYDHEEASTAFALSSVNRQWRNLALDTSDIWTCVTVPGFGVDGSGCLERVKTMLARSRDRDLCLMTCWFSCNWNASPYYKRILDALGKHAHRWRKASFFFPEETPESALEFLRLPLGRLEDLVLWTASEAIVNWSIPTKCMPLHPQLRHLVNNVLFSVPLQPLNNLVYLYMISDGSSPIDIWASLHMTPSLIELHIEAPNGIFDWSIGPPAPVALPVLRILALYGLSDPPAAWVASLQLPSLQSLSLGIDDLSSWSPMLDTVAQTVTSLTIDGVSVDSPFLVTHMQEARKLHQLRRLTLSRCTFVGSDMPLVLATRETTGLPHLEGISFVHPMLDEEQACYLANLMQSLSTPASSHRDNMLSFAMKASTPDVPRWLLQRYKFLFRDACNDGEAGTGTDASSTSSESADEEEAAFTDGTSESTSDYASDSDLCSESDPDWQESEGVEDGG